MEIFAVRTPLGLIVPTRAPFGPTNMPSKWQRYILGILKDLKGFGRLFWVYADDIVIACDKLDELYRAIRQTLQALANNGITLGAGKVRIGYPSAIVLGALLSSDGMSPNPDHIAALDRIRYPESGKEIQRLLGFFGYFSDFIPNFQRYAAKVRQYQDKGSRKKFARPLPADAREAIDHLKGVLRENPVLHPFDADLQLFIDTDASQYGVGAVAYQMREGKKCPIAFFSKTLSPAQQRWVAYVREAYGLYWALSKCSDLVKAAALETIVIVDQSSLRWIYKSTAPKIVRWLVTCLQELRYRVIYRKGELNLAADALSRVPCVKDGVPTEEGQVVAVESLLATTKGLPQLPKQQRKRNLLVSVAGESPLISKSSLAADHKFWKVLRTAATLTTLKLKHWDAAVIIPEASAAPSVAALAMHYAQHRPLAILLPIDMLWMVYAKDMEPWSSDVIAREQLRQKLLRSKKIVYSADNLVWILSNWPEQQVSGHHIFSMELNTGPTTGNVRDILAIDKPEGLRWAQIFVNESSEPLSSVQEDQVEGLIPIDPEDRVNVTPLLAWNRRVGKPPTREEILAELKSDPQAQVWESRLNQPQTSTIQVRGGALTRSSTEEGFLTFTDSASADAEDGVGSQRRYVPKSLRYQLTAAEHVRAHGRGPQKLYETLRQEFWWPKMQQDIQRWVKSCFHCMVAKARRIAKHHGYATYEVQGPHKAYGMDYWDSHVLGIHGYKYILHVVDLFHGYNRYFPTRTMTAEETSVVLCCQLFVHKGPPTVLLSDRGPAFMGKVTKQVARILSAQQAYSAPYAPWMMGRVERGHQLLNQLMRMLPAASKKDWPISVVMAASVSSNHSTPATMDITPYEVENLRPLPSILTQVELTPGQIERYRRTAESIQLGFGSPESLETSQERWFTHISTLRQAQKLYIPAVRNQTGARRARAVVKKNQMAKRAKPSFQVGDAVQIYAPTSRSRAPDWRAGWTIERKTRSGYRVKDSLGTTTRPVAANHVLPQHPVDENEANTMAIPDADIYQSYKEHPEEDRLAEELRANHDVAVLASDRGHHELWLARITAIDLGEDEMTVHYFGSEEPELKGHWFLTHLGRRNRIRLSNLPEAERGQPRELKGFMPWVGTCGVEATYLCSVAFEEVPPTSRGAHNSTERVRGIPWRLTQASQKRLQHFLTDYSWGQLPRQTGAYLLETIESP